MDPNASRETLDHSIMYIFAVALEDGDWHHIKSYTKSRANRKSTIKIWKSITTHEDKKWTKKYHDPNPMKKSFGAKVIVTLNNGIEDRFWARQQALLGRKIVYEPNSIVFHEHGLNQSLSMDRALRVCKHLQELHKDDIFSWPTFDSEE